MKILHTTDSGGIYGKERMMLALVKKQTEEGHHVHVMGFGKPDVFEEAAKICEFSYHLQTVKQLWIHLGSISGYDVVHAHDYKTGIIAAAWNATHSKQKHKFVRTVHGYTGCLKEKRFTKLNFYEKLDRFMLRYNTAVIAVSQQLGDLVGAPVILNGIEKLGWYDDMTTTRREDIVEFCNSGVDLYEKPTIFCCMARLSPEKNLAALIEAILTVDGAKLLLFGDGPLRAELEQMCSWYDGKVFFAGFDKNSRYYLPLVDAYIQPSLKEGLPISVLEALSLGIPLFTSRVGQMEMLQQADVATNCGISSGMIMQTMHTFMDGMPARKELGKDKGIKLFNELFSAEAMYREYNKVYLEA